MISKRRPLLYDILGEGPRSVRRNGQRDEPLAPHAGAISRGAIVAMIGGVAIIGVILVNHLSPSGGPPSTGAAPLLQSNTLVDREAAPLASTDAVKDGTHAVCVKTVTYRNAAGRKAARAEVQEIVDFLGSLPDPAFRDARGVELPGEKGAGCYCIYVGSANSRTELRALRDKVVALEYPRGGRRFADAYATMIARTKKQ